MTRRRSLTLPSLRIIWPRRKSAWVNPEQMTTFSGETRTPRARAR